MFLFFTNRKIRKAEQIEKPVGVAGCLMGAD
jgi:hypothetical protein